MTAVVVPEPNRFRGMCAVCHAAVPAGAGTRTVLPGSPSWVTVCLGCVPVPTGPRAATTTVPVGAGGGGGVGPTNGHGCRCATRATPEGGVSLYLCPMHVPLGILMALGGGV